MTSASRQAGPADRAAGVWWFDIREVTLGPTDLADLDPRESARAAAFAGKRGPGRPRKNAAPAMRSTAARAPE
jgi:hypothetical protein